MSLMTRHTWIDVVHVCVHHIATLVVVSFFFVALVGDSSDPGFGFGIATLAMFILLPIAVAHTILSLYVFCKNVRPFDKILYFPAAILLLSVLLLLFLNTEAFFVFVTMTAFFSTGVIWYRFLSKKFKFDRRAIRFQKLLVSVCGLQFLIGLIWVGVIILST